MKHPAQWRGQTMKNTTKQIKFIVNAVKWFDKVNGNTYHSVRITRVSDSAMLVSHDCVYGYGDHYRQTALEIMLKNLWIPERYGHKNTNGSTNLYAYERENGYPIYWNCIQGLKRDMKDNVKYYDGVKI